MYCHKCNNKLHADERFCPVCGTPVQQAAPQQSFCRECGQKLEAGDVFCANCGVAIDDAQDMTVTSAAAGPKCAAETEDATVRAFHAPEDRSVPRNKKHTGLIIVLAVLLLAIVAIGALFVKELLPSKEVESENTQEVTKEKEQSGLFGNKDKDKEEKSKTITIVVYGRDGGEETFEIQTGEKYLLEAMMAEELIKGEESSGMFIAEVVGTEEADPDAGESWQCSRSGESVKIDLDNCYILDGDQYEFRLQEAQKETAELSGYMEGDMNELRDDLEELGYEGWLWDNLATWTTDYTIEITQCGYSQKIHRIRVEAPAALTLEGVAPGMETQEAFAALERRGYTQRGSEEGKRTYIGIAYRVDVFYDDAVTSVVMAQEGTYNKDSCTICQPVLAVSEYLLPDSNVRYLEYSDLEHLTHEELCFARNEIYARHGRQFKVREIAEYFATKSWYSGVIPAASFNTNVLNDYEKENIFVIESYEEIYYGGSYY